MDLYELRNRYSGLVRDHVNHLGINDWTIEICVIPVSDYPDNSATSLNVCIFSDSELQNIQAHVTYPGTSGEECEPYNTVIDRWMFLNRYCNSGNVTSVEVVTLPAPA